MPVAIGKHSGIDTTFTFYMNSGICSGRDHWVSEKVEGHD